MKNSINRIVLLLTFLSTLIFCVQGHALSIASGVYHSCILLDNGKLKCWGYNHHGQVGNGNTSTKGDSWGEMGDNLAHVNLGRDQVVVQVALGYYHTCAILSDGKVKCWGNGGNGRLGYGDIRNRGDEPGEMGSNLPYVDLGEGLTAKQIALGRNHTCALVNNGRVKCWGMGSYLGYGGRHARGDNPNEMGDNLPFVDLGEGLTAKQIIVGHSHNCALLNNNSVKCWGDGRNGRLGYGNTASRGDDAGEMGDALPYVDFGEGRTVKAIDSGAHHSCAILDNDRIKCWGHGGTGRLGYGNTRMVGDGPSEMGDNLSYVDLGEGRTVKKLSLGDRHSCALLDNYRIKCWGNGGDGQLGLGNRRFRGDSPREMGDDLPYVDLGRNRTVKQVSSGYRHNCAILDNDQIKCWGHAGYGQLGIGGKSIIGDGPGEMGDNLPYLELGSLRMETQLAAGYGHSCVLLSNYKVKCWGKNESGQLGNGGTNSIGDSPGEMGRGLPYLNFGVGRTTKRIALGKSHSCAILDNDELKCWGGGGDGQLGYEDTENRGDALGEMSDTLPYVNLGSGQVARQIAVGEAHSCAILGNDHVKCWGSGVNGRTGYGDESSRGDAPGTMGDDLPYINLGNGRTAKQIAVGAAHTCVLLDNNKVKCWGSGSQGQLGYGSINDLHSPPDRYVNLGSRRTAKHIVAGSTHTCVILNNNQIKCWGSGTNGRLGYGDTNDLRSPISRYVSLGWERSAKQISAGDDHTCAVLDDGGIKCWGSGANGRLGYGDTADIHAPTNYLRFGEGQSAKQVVAGGAHSCALLDDDSITCWGFGRDGRLGNGSPDDVGDDGDLPPPLHLGQGQGAKDFATGAAHICAVLTGGLLKCWGKNDQGQLGYGDSNNRGDGAGEMGDALPNVDLGLGQTVKEVALGKVHTCAILEGGKVKCWGGGDYGTLGHGDRGNRGDGLGEMGDSLLHVDLGTDLAARRIVAGSYHTCAIFGSGKIKCWGRGTYGQLGLGSSDNKGDGTGEMGDALPYVNLGEGLAVKKIALGEAHSCAIVTGDKVKCWGSGSRGQLGYGDIDSRGDGPEEMGESLPFVDLGLGRTAKQIAAGDHHTCAILDNYKVKCWGYGPQGELGLGDANNRGNGSGEMGDDLPYLDLGNERRAKQITAGGSHTCVLLDNYKVKCWGKGTRGQLGYGDTVNRGDDTEEMGDALPSVDLGSGREAKKVAAGSAHSCALLKSGKIKCWGFGREGNLGGGDRDNRGDERNEMGNFLPELDLGTEGCAVATNNNCLLDSTGHGGIGGTCIVGYNGSCSYSCSEGSWIKVSNTCREAPPEPEPDPEPPPPPPPSNCAGQSIAGCRILAADHGETSGTCIDGYSGNCSYRCDDGSWTHVSGSCAEIPPPPPPSNCAGQSIAGCRILAADHGATSGTCIDGYSGNCSYRCNDGSWTQVSNSCAEIPLPPPPSNCAGQSIAGCTLASVSNGQTGQGTCGRQSSDPGSVGYYLGSCSYSCSNGTWTAVNPCKAAPLPTLHGIGSTGDGTNRLCSRNCGPNNVGIMWSCSGPCTGRKNAMYCRELKVGDTHVSLGPAFDSADGSAGDCPKGSVAAGFNCTGNCSGSSYATKCAEPKWPTGYPKVHLVGHMLTSASPDGSGSCPSSHVGVGHRCFPDCQGSIALVCASFSFAAEDSAAP